MYICIYRERAKETVCVCVRVRALSGVGVAHGRLGSASRYANMYDAL